MSTQPLFDPSDPRAQWQGAVDRELAKLAPIDEGNPVPDDIRALCRDLPGFVAGRRAGREQEPAA